VRKSKPDLVYDAPMDKTITGNAQVFQEAIFSNPIAKNSELLFEPLIHNHNDPDRNKVNQKHPCAPFYLKLINCYKQEKSPQITVNDQGYIDINSNNVRTYNPYLDSISLGNNTDSEDNMKAGPPLKRKVWNPGGIHFAQQDTQAYKEGWNDRDNNPDSYAYNGFDNGYHRYVSLTNHFAHINNEQLVALNSSLCNLISNVEHNKMPHSVNCAKCVKKHKDQIDLLADSGASLHFTNQRSDLSNYEVVNKKDFTVTMASASHPLTVAGQGSMYLMTSGNHKEKESGQVIRLYPVFYVKGLTHKYLSVGALLNSGFELRGSSSKLEFRTHNSNQLEFLCDPHKPGQNLYWLSASLVHADSLLAMSMVSSIDYNIMHRCFAHPSMDVLRHASENTQGFPNILIPRENPICPRCAEGKMTKSSFPASDQWSTKPFDKVHMDLKSMPTRYYCRYNFSLILFDDCTSHGWTVNLKHKSDANPAI
jgi:hypothetical protein